MATVLTSKFCPGCSQTKDLDDFARKHGGQYGRREYCKICGSAQTRKWQIETYGSFSAYQRWLRYGLKPDKYDDMVQMQNGKCAICEQPPQNRALAVDHCHITGRVRGLLCTHCNTALGNFRDNPYLLQRAMEYLK